MARMTLAATADDQATPASSTAQMVPLDQLYLHPLNPRQEPPTAEIEALAASISAVGLLQNLSGFADTQIRLRPGHDQQNPDAIGIVAGGRRLRALQMLAARGEWSGPVPVQVTDDADLAAQWPGAESETQRALPVVDRIQAYAQMRHKGHAIDAIATAFGTPISDVRRLLALVNLPDDALDALRAGKISYGVAQALTAARDGQTQAVALESALAGKPDWQIKDMLRKGSVTGRDMRARFVGLAAYHDAGGTSTLDLFDDLTVLHDPDLLDRLAQAKGESEVEAIRIAEGWSWALFTTGAIWQITEDMHRICGDLVPLPKGDAERLEELESLDEDTMVEADIEELRNLTARASHRAFTDAHRNKGGIVANIDAKTGALRVDRAFLRKEDTATTSGDDGTIDIGPAATEPSMPQNLKNDLRHIRLIAIQNALRRDEVLCHDLLALQLTRRLKPWEEPFALDQIAATPPAKLDGFTIPAQLAAPQIAGNEDAATALADWQAKASGNAINAALYTGLARAFCRTDGPFVDLISARIPVTPRSIWTPTVAGFLGRVSAGYLNSLWRELVPDEGSRHAGFDTLSKKEKARELEKLFSDLSFREALGLSRAQNEAIDAWLPEELRFGGAAEQGDA